MPAATWTSSSRPSQKGTPCSSRTLARQWTLCWTPSWAGTRSRRGSEWPRPPPRSQAREPSRRPGPPARSGACRARPLPPGGQQGLRRSAAGVREPQVPEGKRSCGATSPPRVPASFYQDDLQTADLHGHVFISVNFSLLSPPFISFYYDISVADFKLSFPIEKIVYQSGDIFYQHILTQLLSLLLIYISIR